MRGLIAGSLATARLNTILLLALATLAFVLAAVGVYGVVAHFVAQRTREIGIRIALGASSRQIWSMVFGRGLEPILFGVVLGIVGAFMAGRLLRNQLFGVTPSDPLTIGAVAAVLLGAAVVATYVPARRAMRVDPTVALGAE